MPRSSYLKSFPLLWLLALLAVVAIFGTLAGCETSDGRQHVDNPFDPDGSAGGDALQVSALVITNQIRISWNQPQNMGIADYVVLSADSRFGSYTELAIVAHTSGASGSYIYDYPPPTRTHWFKVQAFTTNGQFSLASLAVPATASIGPTVVVGDTITTTATRFTELTVTADLGDSLLVAFDASFAGAVRLAQAGPGLPTTFPLDLGPAAADSTFRLHIKSFGSLSTSETTVFNLPVAFDPKHRLTEGSPLRLATRVNDLTIPASGVVNMRFAASEDELATAPWLPGAELYPAYELVDSANPQEIWAEYEGDFGFNTTSKLAVRPDLLASAAYFLKVPDTRVVSSLTVVAEFSAGATDLRISESPNFAAVPWQAYADTATFILSPEEGTKTVYVQFRNDWTQSTVLSDYCILVAQGPDVNFIAPMMGDVLVGGSNLMTIGTSTPGNVATALDSLLVDLGDGQGFREVLGTDNWQLVWNVPTFETDTEVTIRARAVVDSLVATDFVTVTVSQVGIQIADPLDGVLVLGGDPLPISGTANGILSGAPIDSVIVDIGAERLVATGTDAWNVTWLAPIVTVDTPTDITATVWSNSLTATETITVTVTP